MNALKVKHTKDKTFLYVLYWVVNEFDFEKIVSVKPSKEAYDILEKVYKGDDRVKQFRLQTLKSELEYMKMNETEGVTKYKTCVETMVNHFSRNGSLS